MHLIRRAAFRVAGSASTSIASAPRSFTTTSSPFLARSKIQSAVNPSVFRRFSSDEAKPIESADAGEAETLRSALESSSESRSGSVGTASSAYESFSDNPGSDSRTLYRNRDDTSRREQYGSLRSRPERVVNPSNGVYVGNLLFEITAAELEKEFSQYGTVKSSTVATDSRGLSKGFGYIEFETVEQAKAAIDAKDQMVFEGRRMIVNYMARSNRPTRTNPPSKTLFIGNLAFEMSDADLNKLFRDIRNVLDVRVAIDRRTGQPRGFAHADFVDISSAEAGKEVLDGKEIYGRKLRVDFSAGKERSPPRSPFQRSEQPL